MKFIDSTFSPVKISDCPGAGIKGKCSFTNGTETWEEDFNLIDILSSVLKTKKIKHKQSQEYIQIDDILIKPEIASIQPDNNKNVSTTTIISFYNQQYLENGAFEYQHAFGNNIRVSTTNGFENWLDYDFPVIQESISNKLECCTAMEICSEEHKKRKVFLGPILHMAQKPITTDEDHPFCQCCFITNNFDSFTNQIKGNGFYAIRLLATRTENGIVNADCRINGIDYEIGKSSLIDYAKKWPDHGVEMRKQYVIIRDIE